MKKRIFLLSLAFLLGFGASACTPDGQGGTTSTATDNSALSSSPETNSYAGVSDDAPPPAPDQPVVNVSDTESGGQTPVGSISLVVLGDSIARGYGLDNVETQRFSALLSDMLLTDYADVDIKNYGVDGLTGAQLVSQLKQENIDGLENCDYVLVSIGGNNVLGGLTEMSGIAQLLGGIDPAILSDYGKYIAAQDDATKKECEYAVKALDTLLAAVNDAFAGESFEKLVTDAAKNLEAEIPQIVAEIKGKNPNAKIIIQTVYNPYKDVKISLPYVTETVALSTYGDKAVKGLNNVINSLAEAQGYTAAPVYDSFAAAKQGLINAKFSLFTLQISVDPHPNARGHKEIANIYYALIKEGENA